jgi:hypothetical protein
MELTEEAEADVFCHLLADPDPVFGFARIISGSFFGHFSGFSLGPQGKVTLPNSRERPRPYTQAWGSGFAHRTQRTREHGGDLRD